MFFILSQPAAGQLEPLRQTFLELDVMRTCLRFESTCGRPTGSASFLHSEPTFGNLFRCEASLPACSYRW